MKAGAGLSPAGGHNTVGYPGSAFIGRKAELSARITEPPRSGTLLTGAADRVVGPIATTGPEGTRG
jgi:hypothetical protein